MRTGKLDDAVRVDHEPQGDEAADLKGLLVVTATLVLTALLSWGGVALLVAEALSGSGETRLHVSPGGLADAFVSSSSVVPR